jgi:hypothetical protein
MARTVRTARSTRASSHLRLVQWLLFLSGLLCWGALLWFTYDVYPAATVTFFLFFLLLLGALTFTLIVPVYRIGIRFFFARSHRMTLPRAFSLSLVCALAIVLNLILRALHSWSLIMAVVIIAAAVVVDILLLARKV